MGHVPISPTRPVQYKENMEMRMKHAGAPERFMDSEVDLDEVCPGLNFVRSLVSVYTLMSHCAAELRKYVYSMIE